MLSRQAILKQCLKPTLKFLKVDNMAHIHFGCPHNLKLTLSSSKYCKRYRRNGFSTALQARYESSSSPTIHQTSNENAAGLDPIPEPPIPLTPISDVTQSTVEVYSTHTEVEKHLETEVFVSTNENSIDAAFGTSVTTPEILKSVLESCNGTGTSTPVARNSSLLLSSSTADNNKEIILESSSFPHQLSHEDTKRIISPMQEVNQSTSTDYSSVFDSLPEPPVVHSQSCTSMATESLSGEATFASLGLGGWSPAGMVQSALEFLHVDCGLPWWGAVVCGTLVIRLAMFPLVVIGQRNAARLNNNLPQMQHLQLKTSEARQRGDKMEAARYTAEMMKFMQEKNINPLKNLLPALCQAPVFISVFVGLRGMANLSLESLKTGGMWWFVDLTVPDQFYILPIATSATLFCTLKVGADTGQTTQNMMIMKYIVMVLPVILVPFTINFPGLMLVYWASSNFITLVQVGFLRIPKAREYFGIEKKVQHQENNLAIKDKGFIGNVKDAWTKMKITSELENRERADKMAFLKAGREPIKKTYKYDPTQVRQSSTAIQAKKRM